MLTRTVQAASLLFAATMSCACTAVQTRPPQASLPDGPETIAFKARAADATIAGEVRIAQGPAPKTAVVIVGGSGVRSREDTAGALPVFMSETSAVAIYDRRGSGESTGVHERPGTLNSGRLVPLFAGDTLAVVRHLKSIGFGTVGLVGSSMGGWISVSAAAQSDEVDFVIAIGGGGSSVGVSDAYDTLTDQGLGLEEAAAKAAGHDGPQGYDPGPDLASINVPFLWIFGDKDDSNPTALDLENIRALKAKGKDFSIIVLENVGHDMTNVETGEFDPSWIEPAKQFIAAQ